MGSVDVDLVIADPVWTGRGIQRGLAVRGGRVAAVGDAALALRATAREGVDAPGRLAAAPAPPPRPPAPPRARGGTPPPAPGGGRGRRPAAAGGDLGAGRRR